MSIVTLFIIVCNMCYSPISIPNNSYSGHLNVKRQRFVPCGNCLECQSKYQGEWYIRSYYQWLETKKLGGSSVFITLTYAPQFRPYFSDTYEYAGETINFNIPCFSKWHIQRFIKYVKRYCVKYLDYSVEDSENIKYIICSEYGKDPNHERLPHYHGQLFFPKFIHYYQLVSILRFAWSNSKLVEVDGKKKYIHIPLGFFSFGKYGAFITSPTALKYCMKYTTKELNGFTDIKNKDNERICSIIDYLKTCPNQDKIKPYLPFHLQSRGFGIYGLEKLTDVDIIEGRIKDPLINKDTHKETYVSLPTYYRHKLFHSKPLVDNNGKVGMYRYNEKYFEYLPKMLKFQVSQKCEKLLANFYSFADFKKAYNITDDTCLNLCGCNLENIFDEFNDNIRHRLFDFVCFCYLQNYSSYKLDYRNNLFETLHLLKRRDAEEHNYLVNSFDLTAVLPDFKKVLGTYSKSYIYKVPNPFYSPSSQSSFLEYCQLMGYESCYYPLYDRYLEYLRMNQESFRELGFAEIECVYNEEVPDSFRLRSNYFLKKYINKDFPEFGYGKKYVEFDIQNSSFFKDFVLFYEVFSKLENECKRIKALYNYNNWLTNKKFKERNYG